MARGERVGSTFRRFGRRDGDEPCRAPGRDAPTPEFTLRNGQPGRDDRSSRSETSIPHRIMKSGRTNETDGPQWIQPIPHHANHAKRTRSARRGRGDFPTRRRTGCVTTRRLYWGRFFRSSGRRKFRAVGKRATQPGELRPELKGALRCSFGDVTHAALVRFDAPRIPHLFTKRDSTVCQRTEFGLLFDDRNTGHAGARCRSRW